MQYSVSEIMAKAAGTENVKVAVRVRPFISFLLLFKRYTLLLE